MSDIANRPAPLDSLTPSDQELYHYVYRSTAADDLGRAEIDAIVRRSGHRNEVFGLTGCLHHEDGLFFQWLEGPRYQLDQIVNKIRRDPRHQDIEDLSYGPLTRRIFGSWTMRSTDRSDGSLTQWLTDADVSTYDRRGYASSVGAFLKSFAA
ncbi:BLUF domain-containing protein [Paracoccus sp. TK19116]|uniref:BLUF domain-containing protein n=1 Tax=Paracoccus albicereus TaxID=2922394 RepID=A0ABT1MQZ7_9RHOB|nr:BLUF domain-containing protein [Paracoccus albicereus]MCQ0969951.1 BLUF domain-containing protein [Paracoccus albicereus]